MSLLRNPEYFEQVIKVKEKFVFVSKFWPRQAPTWSSQTRLARGKPAGYPALLGGRRTVTTVFCWSTECRRRSAGIRLTTYHRGTRAVLHWRKCFSIFTTITTIEFFINVLRVDFTSYLTRFNSSLVVIKKQFFFFNLKQILHFSFIYNPAIMLSSLAL